MIYRFDDIVLDEARRTLSRGDTWLQTEPKVFDVLLYLIKNRERAVMREELLENCWPHVHVSDGTLSRCMSRVRHAIGQARLAAQPIYTLHGKGYRFVAPVTEEESADAEGHAMPRLAEERNEDGPSAEAERRFVSLLCCMFSLPEAPGVEKAEALHSALHRFLGDCELVLQRFGGELFQRGGERIEARFGHPASAERAAEAAVLSAQELLPRVAERGLTARIGIASGRAIVDPPFTSAVDAGGGMVVEIDPLQPAAICAAAAEQTYVVDQNTRRLAEATFAARTVGEAVVAGQAVPVFALTPRQGRVHADDEDMVFSGRGSELAFLEHCWRYARDGHGQVIHLTGEAGIGKSRLVREMIRRANVPPERLILAECSPYGQMTPFYPLLLQLRRLLGIEHDTPPLRQLAAIEDLLKRLGQPESDHLPLLASLLAVSTPMNRLPQLNLDIARQRERTMEALVFLVYSMAEQGPLILWIDDVQWADPSTLDVVSRVRGRASSAKILLVLAGRGAGKRLGNDLSGATTIALAPFTRSETLRFLDFQGGRVSLTREQVDYIASRSDGIPLFLREIMRMVGDQFEEPETAAIPGTLHSLLQSRLDQAGEAKGVAQWVALFGASAEKKLLTRCSGIPQNELEDALVRLTAIGLLREDGRGRSLRYGFSHSLLRDVAYDSQLAVRRRERHRCIADTLVADFPELAQAQPEEVARHYDASDEPALAAPYWRAAGQASATHEAADEARALYGKALGSLRRGNRQSEANAYMDEIDRLLAAL